MSATDGEGVTKHIAHRAGERTRGLGGKNG